jgi:hypothetical protein
MAKHSGRVFSPNCTALLARLTPAAFAFCRVGLGAQKTKTLSFQTDNHLARALLRSGCPKPFMDFVPWK